MTILEQKIKQKIKESGSIAVDEFFEIAMFDPEYGYYIKKSPIGKGADFITAPEISQIFGEIIACFMYFQMAQNKKQDFCVAEIGAGRGTLLFDIAETLQKLGKKNTEFFIMDVNENLVKEQKEKLKKHNVKWIKDLSEIGEKPLAIIANELFDVFPLKQFVKKKNGYAERKIRLNSKEELEFFEEEKPVHHKLQEVAHNSSKEGQLLEISEKSIAFMQQAAELLLNNKGLALFFDYGYWDAPGISTLQSVMNHRKNEVFHNIGEADLTYLVDFKGLFLCAKEAGIADAFYQTQGEFLTSMGVYERVQKLASKLNSAEKNILISGVKRLVDPTHMGEIFKCLVLENY